MTESSTGALQEAHKVISTLKANLQRNIFGQEELIDDSLCCLLAGGHILMTGAPGLAKTTLVRVFASQLQMEYNRIQFTPDLLPTDITGSDILNIDPESGRRSFEFAKGPVFTNLLLADEINRASPRTQSALLEAMQERSLTVAGKQYQLPLPFLVFATQNPFESEGTFPLPEAQLDRFLLHTLVSYPGRDDESKILKAHSESKLIGEQRSLDIDPSLTIEGILELQKISSNISIADELLDVINQLVRATRGTEGDLPESLRKCVQYGAGPRAGISFISTSRALALIEGSETVRWRHIKRLAKPILRHRIHLNMQARRDRMNEDEFVDHVVAWLEDKYQHLTQAN